MTLKYDAKPTLTVFGVPVHYDYTVSFDVLEGLALNNGISQKLVQGSHVDVGVEIPESVVSEHGLGAVVNALKEAFPGTDAADANFDADKVVITMFGQNAAAPPWAVPGGKCSVGAKIEKYPVPKPVSQWPPHNGSVVASIVVKDEIRAIYHVVVHKADHLDEIWVDGLLAAADAVTNVKTFNDYYLRVPAGELALVDLTDLASHVGALGVKELYPLPGAEEAVVVLTDDDELVMSDDAAAQLQKGITDHGAQVAEYKQWAKEVALKYQSPLKTGPLSSIGHLFTFPDDGASEPHKIELEPPGPDASPLEHKAYEVVTNMAGAGS